MCEWSLSNGHSKMRLSIFRPLYSSNNPVSISTFMIEFAAYLESVVLCDELLLICGGFNIHVDVYDDPNCVTFTDLLDSMGLELKSPTQLHGHTLYLIVTWKSDSIVAGTPFCDNFLSDHYTVLCNLKMSKSNPTVKKVSYWEINSMDYKQFKSDLQASELLWNIPSHLDLVNTYNTKLSALLDKHASLHTRTVAHKTHVPWFTDEIRSIRRLCRQSEQKCMRTKLDNDWQAFKVLRNGTTFVMNMVRRKFTPTLLIKCLVIHRICLPSRKR